MKNFRIKNYYSSGYIVQERAMLVFWNTLLENRCGGFKVFSSIEEAKAHIKERVDYIKKAKDAKYIEYV